jgi:hypothetical protein
MVKAIDIEESAMLNIGQNPTSIKSLTYPNLNLSKIFPKAPATTSDINTLIVNLGFSINIKYTVKNKATKIEI